MIENIITNFSPKLSVFSSAAKNINVNSSVFSKYKEAIKKYLDVVDSRQCISDAFISAFSSNPEVFANEMAGTDVFETSNLYDYEISTDAAELLQSAFLELDTASGSYDRKVSTFTDSSGIPYSFIYFTSDVEIDGNKILIASQNHPMSLKDCILWIDESDKYHFNPIIRMSEFYDANLAEAVNPNSIYDAVHVISVLAQASSASEDIFHTLYNICDTLDINHDIQSINEGVQELMEWAGIVGDGTVQDIITNYQALATYIIEYTGRARIHSTTIYGLVSDLVINNELIDVIRTTYDNVVNGDVAQLASCVTAAIDGKSKAVRSFGNQILLGFSKNGALGALAAIVDLLKTLFSSQPTGYRVFDTSSSIPQAFSAGFIAIATGIAQTLFQILSGVMQPIVAIIGSIGYGVFSVISNVINANVSEEYARIEDLEKTENIAPYAIWGKSFNISESPASTILGQYVYNDDRKLVKIKDLLDWSTLNGNPLLTISWASFIIKMAYVDPSISSEGQLSATKIVINVFPTVCDVSNSMPNYTAEGLISNLRGYITSISLNSAGTGKIYFQNVSGLTSSILGSLSSRARSMCSYTSWDYTPTVVNDNFGQYAGYVKTLDAELRRIVCRNALLLLAFCYAFNSGSYTIDSTGNDYVNVNLVNLVPTIQMDGNAYPLLEIVFGAIGRSNIQFGTYDGHTIWLQDETHSYESIGKAFTKFQDSSTANTHVLQLFYAIARCRSDYQYSSNYVKPEISFRASYADIPYFIPPKYTRGSVIKSIVIGALIVITTAVIVAVATVSVKRKIEQQRSIRQAKVDAAWTALTEDPTADNYRRYKKTVKANNRFARIFGGTKYDYVNYWNGDTSSSHSSTSPVETIRSYISANDDTTTDLPINSVSSIIKLINGEG